MKSEDLSDLRARIDAIDAELLGLLNQRAAIAQEVGRRKNGQVYRAEREAQVVARIRQLNGGPLGGDAVAFLFREIMSACRALEEPLRIAFLGPEGTFSQTAAHKHFGHAVSSLAVATIDEAFRAVETGRGDYGVVPVENSTEGAVSRTLDLIVGSPLQICGEVLLPVHQNLLRKRVGLDALKRVCSHGQSLAQCQHWLDHNLPGVARVSVASNAEAARLAGEDEGTAAIAGEEAAELYGLHVLAAHIEDEANNTTRFLVLSNHDAGPSGRDKTSLVMSIPNRPGALVELLKPIAEAGVSMTKLESRPSKSANWDYVFFLDLEGHREDAKIAALLAAIGNQAVMLKVLGSYPAAV